MVEELVEAMIEREKRTGSISHKQIILIKMYLFI
jgi:hypothetical protein